MNKKKTDYAFKIMSMLLNCSIWIIYRYMYRPLYTSYQNLDKKKKKKVGK